jgi:hypothetical protein
MRVEMSPNQVWADVEHPTFDTDSQPASLILPISFNHIFSDRYTEFSLRLELEFKFSKHK